VISIEETASGESVANTRFTWLSGRHFTEKASKHRQQAKPTPITAITIMVMITIQKMTAKYTSSALLPPNYHVFILP
jgi:hypothetical protein